MDLTACVICVGDYGTNGCHLAVFSEDVAFAHHFMATHPPSTLPPYCSASDIDYAGKSYLKWWAIQLAIHSIVGE